jgi:hypothetical protein
LATDDLRRWQLGGLLGHDRVKIVGQAGDLLLGLARGIVAAERRVVIIAPGQQLIGQLAPGCVAVAVSDDGYTAAAVTADYVLWPADVHQAAAALRWALTAAAEGSSVVLQVVSHPVPLIWSPNTKFSPDRWVTVGAGDTLVLAFGSTMAPLRAVMEQGKKSIRAINITDCVGDQAARQAVRALTVGSTKVVIIRSPEQGGWLAETLRTIKKDYTDVVLKPDWRGIVEYTDADHVKAISDALKKRS